jgi:ribonuclease HI
MKDKLILQFDGGSRGNPGPAGYGVVISSDDGVPLVTIGSFIGNATNNVAEYRGLIRGLEEALKLNATRLEVVGDSELVIRQMRREYKVRNPGLKPLFERADALAAKFQFIHFDHTRRDNNTLADKLANLAMTKRTEITEPPL